MAKKNGKKASLGWFFWVAFIALVALLFFINKDNIKSVLEKTNAKTIFQKKEGGTEAVPEPDLAQIQKEIEKITAFEEKAKTKKNAASKNGKKNKQNASAKETEEETALHTAETDYDEEDVRNKGETAGIKKDGILAAGLEHTDNGTKEKQAHRKTVLFFVHVENDGKIVKRAVNRELAKTGSPMTAALTALFKGPTAQEAKQGFRSFIPPATRLLSAYVKNGTAVINLSEEFQFNQYGIEAYQAQLAQIVFTVCEFPTVDAVQFLIEGEKKQYLGGEGVWVGSPLSVNSF